MAGRFVFQKLTSGITGRSTSRLASASSRATAPVNRAWEDGTKSLGTALPNSRGLHGRASSGIGTLSNLFNGAAVRPGMVVPSNHEILRGSGARYLRTRTRRQPSVSKHKKSALVDSFGEGKPKNIELYGHDASLLKTFLWACVVGPSMVVIACTEGH